MEMYNDNDFIGEFDDVGFDAKMNRSGTVSINAIPAQVEPLPETTVIFPDQILSRTRSPEFQIPKLPLLVKDFDRPKFQLTTAQWVMIGAGVLVAYTLISKKSRRKVIG